MAKEKTAQTFIGSSVMGALLLGTILVLLRISAQATPATIEDIESGESLAGTAAATFTLVADIYPGTGDS
jgi:membrane protein CcdC involved in cytochrome C biogenesis